jgi:hypothetical protein
MTKASAPTPDQGIPVPDQPPNPVANRFALHPKTVADIHATAALLDVDASVVANGAGQFYAFLADLVAKGWQLVGIDPEDGVGRPIEWSGFDKITQRQKESGS